MKKLLIALMTMTILTGCQTSQQETTKNEQTEETKNVVPQELQTVFNSLGTQEKAIEHYTLPGYLLTPDKDVHNLIKEDKKEVNAIKVDIPEKEISAYLFYLDGLGFKSKDYKNDYDYAYVYTDGFVGMRIYEITDVEAWKKQHPEYKIQDENAIIETYQLK